MRSPVDVINEYDSWFNELRAHNSGDETTAEFSVIHDNLERLKSEARDILSDTGEDALYLACHSNHERYIDKLKTIAYNAGG